MLSLGDSSLEVAHTFLYQGEILARDSSEAQTAAEKF